MNKVEILGRIGSVRIQNVGDTRVANFSVVTEYTFNDRDGSPVVETTWHNCVLWEHWSGQLDGLEKGIPVHIIGRLRDRSYVAQDGTRKRVVEIIAQELQITSGDLQLHPQK